MLSSVSSVVNKKFYGGLWRTLSQYAADFLWFERVFMLN